MITNQWPKAEVHYYRSYTLVVEKEVLIYDMGMELIDQAPDLEQARKIIDDWQNAR